MSFVPSCRLSQKHVNDAYQYVDCLLNKLDKKLLYHNKSHTFDFVYKNAILLAKSENCTKEEQFLVTIAALFHDTGFLKKYQNNESIGVDYCFKYMKDSVFPFTKKHFQTIKNAILATSLSNFPKTHLEKIVRDADLSVLGQPGKVFIYWNQLLMIESKQSKDIWLISQINFLKSISWQTKSAKILYNQNLLKNISAINSQMI